MAAANDQEVFLSCCQGLRGGCFLAVVAMRCSHPRAIKGGGLVILVLVMGSAGCIDVVADSTV